MNSRGGYCSLINNIKFLKVKIKKFYWIYFIAFIMSMALLFLQIIIGRQELDLKGTAIKSVLYLSLTQVWIPIEEYIYSIVPACWYLSMVMVLYFFQYWLVYFTKTLKRIHKFYWGAFATLVLSLLTILLKDNDYCNYILYFFPFTRLIDFWLGIILGMLMFEDKGIIKTLTQTIIQLAAIVIFSVSLFVYPSLPWQYNVYYLLVAMLLVGSCSLKEGIVSRISNHPIIYKLADVTYIVFIIHHAVFPWIAAVNNNLLHMNGTIISFFAIAIVVGLAFILKASASRFSLRKG